MGVDAPFRRIIAYDWCPRGGNHLLVILLLALIALALPNPAAARVAANKCRAPVAWRIGVVDREFGITPQSLHRMAHAAARRWNQLAGKVVIVYQPNARFTINMRYGLRQETAETIKDLHADAAQRKAMLDKMVRVMDRLVGKHNVDSQRYAAKVDAFNREAQRFATRSRNRISERERQQLRRDHDALRRREAALSVEQTRLEETRSQIETLRYEIKARVMRHNNTVTAANQTLRSLPDDARKIGVTHINGPRSKIDLLQYYDDEKLYITLLHELGHALGLEHINDPRSIMYPTQNAQTARDLTASDISALQQLC